MRAAYLGVKGGLAVVVADDPGQHRVTAQSDDVHGDIRRAAGHKALALEIHHGHGRFGRDARNVAPDVAVQHDIADHQYLLNVISAWHFFV